MYLRFYQFNGLMSFDWLNSLLATLGRYFCALFLFFGGLRFSIKLYFHFISRIGVSAIYQISKRTITWNRIIQLEYFLLNEYLELMLLFTHQPNFCKYNPNIGWCKICLKLNIYLTNLKFYKWMHNKIKLVLKYFSFWLDRSYEKLCFKFICQNVIIALKSKQKAVYIIMMISFGL